MILTCGAFDGIHANHVRYLTEAASFGVNQCRWVTASVVSDDYIRTAKGHEPAWNQVERAEAVAGLKRVNGVILEDARGIEAVIRWKRPRLFVKGGDWDYASLRQPILDACEEVGCHIVFTEDFGKHWSDVRF